MKKIYFFLLFSTIAIYSQTKDSSEFKNNYLVFDTHTKVEALFRSIVIPGWGQFYNKQELKGIIFLSSEILLLGSFIYFNERYSKKYDEYTLENDPLNAPRLFDDAEKIRKTRNLAAYLFGGVWLLNIIDAYVFGWNYHDVQIGFSIDNQKLFSIRITL